MVGKYVSRRCPRYQLPLGSLRCSLRNIAVRQGARQLGTPRFKRAALDTSAWRALPFPETPTVKRFDRCRIEMYFGDHPPPHYHVITNDDERVAVEIETGRVLAGTADSRDTDPAIAWARRNKGRLRDRWNMYSAAER